MAVPGGTLTRADLGSGNTDNVREWLGDVIYNIDPTTNPFHANSSRESVDNDRFDHLIDTLPVAVEDNAHGDGDDFIGQGVAGQVGNGDIGTALDAASRVGNYTVISRKDLVISGRAESVNKAGRDSEMSYQMALQGKGLMNDCETAALFPAAGVQTTDTVAGRTAGVPLWLTSNTFSASAAAEGTPTGHNDGVLTNGIPAAPADGFDADATGVMTETLLLTTLASIYGNGGDPDMIMMHHNQKQQMSRFLFSAGQANGARIANQTQYLSDNPNAGATVLGAVDVYQSDFGKIRLVPNRFQRTRDIFVFESGMWAIATLRDYDVLDISKTGDSEKQIILVDWGVMSRNEKASGAIFDVTDGGTWTA